MLVPITLTKGREGAPEGSYSSLLFPDKNPLQKHQFCG